MTLHNKLFHLCFFMVLAGINTWIVMNFRAPINAVALVFCVVMILWILMWKVEK